MTNPQRLRISSPRPRGRGFFPGTILLLHDLSNSPTRSPPRTAGASPPQRIGHPPRSVGTTGRGSSCGHSRPSEDEQGSYCPVTLFSLGGTNGLCAGLFRTLPLSDEKRRDRGARCSTGLARWRHPSQRVRFAALRVSASALRPGLFLCPRLLPFGPLATDRVWLTRTEWGYFCAPRLARSQMPLGRSEPIDPGHARHARVQPQRSA
jgi:hypothetical protein